MNLILENIVIKETDLLEFNSVLNKRYVYRKAFLNKILFNNQPLSSVIKSLNEFILLTKSTPLKIRIETLRDHLLIFLFIKYEFRINDLSSAFEIHVSEIGIKLAKFFYPIYLYERQINNFFQIDSFIEKDKEKNIIDLKNKFKDIRSNETLLSEIRKIDERFLYESMGWDKLVIQDHVDFKVDNLKLRTVSFRKFFKDYFLLTSLMALILFLVLQYNKVNEDSLSSATSVPSRFFTWLDLEDFTNINFLRKNEENDFNRSILEVEGKLSESNLIEDDRFEVESDVKLTSLENISETDIKELEEEQQGGFRDTRFGSKKVYRVMISSSDVINASEKISNVINKFNATKAGNVEAGSQLPGGLYYNLLVPTTDVKSFLTNLDEEIEMSIYLSNSKMSAPNGQTKVFLWVKKI